MLRVLGQILLFPFKAAALLIELLGRTVAVVAGLVAFGLGALLCQVPLLMLLGAPLCLLGAIVVVKAL